MRALCRSVLLALACAGCGPTRPAEPPHDVPRMIGELTSARDEARLVALVAARRSAPALAGYQIGPDDLLAVRIPDLLEPSMETVSGDSAPTVVAGAPVFQQGMRVSAGGEITIPSLGTVHAAGLTAPELQREIAQRLVAAGILRDPQVSVLVAEYRSRVVAVVGSVEHPGLYPVSRPGATISDLIWTAGGPSKEAGRVVAFMPALGTAGAETPPAATPPPARRVPGAGALAVQSVRVEEAAGVRRVAIVLNEPPGGARDFVLANPPRLVIDVDGAAARETSQRFPLADELVSAARTGCQDGRLRIALDLQRDPGPYAVRRHDNVLTAEFGDTSATAAADAADGGRSGPPDPAPNAASGDDDPIRMDLETLLQAGAARRIDPEVRPGDVISIAPAGTVQVDGWVAKPGSYPITRGLTLSGAVAAAGGHLFPADLQRVAVNRVLAAHVRRSFTVDLANVARGEADDLPVVDGDVVRLPTMPARIVPWAFWTVLREVVHIGGSVLLF